MKRLLILFFAMMAMVFVRSRQLNKIQPSAEQQAIDKLKKDVEEMKKIIGVAVVESTR